MNNTLAASLGLVGVIAALIVAAIFIKDGQTFGIISAVVVGTAIPAFIAVLQSNKASTTVAAIETKSDVHTDQLLQLQHETNHQTNILKDARDNSELLIRMQPASEPTPMLTPPLPPPYPPDKAQYDAPSETPQGTSEPPYTGKA